MSVYEFKPDNYSSHMKIIHYIGKSEKKLKVLDIGCSKGFMGKKLGSIHDFYGIDISKEDASIAKRYYKSIKIANLDETLPSYEKNSFDTIIMADVIEHLKNPLKAVLHFKKFLKNDGMLIISAPNIANAYIRLRLLLGNFDYEDRGIMDKTHLKFFTLKSLRKFVSVAGLSIAREDFTPIPLPIVNPVFSEGNLLGFMHDISYFISSLWKKMFAFQFVMYCKKKS